MEDRYWRAVCDKCGWTGSSKLLEGGNSIADTGDFSEVLCPVCWSNKISEVEDAKGTGKTSKEL